MEITREFTTSDNVNIRFREPRWREIKALNKAQRTGDEEAVDNVLCALCVSIGLPDDYHIDGYPYETGEVAGVAFEAPPDTSAILGNMTQSDITKFVEAVMGGN